MFASLLPRFAVWLGVPTVVWVCTATAHAAGLSQKQIQQLQTLSELGQEACERGDYESCQRAFEQAQELLPWAPHRYYIAEALVGRGRLVEGTAIWSQILKDNDPDDCHPSVCQAVRKARERLNAVERQVPRLQFKLTRDYEDLIVRVGELELTGVQLKSETRVNPGRYLLTATARGHEEHRASYEVG
ncbi:MAG: hypothetical protein RJA70_4092, partial [Pseudomonadota bacterium]